MEGALVLAAIASELHLGFCGAGDSEGAKPAPMTVPPPCADSEPGR